MQLAERYSSKQKIIKKERQGREWVRNNRYQNAE